MATAKREIYARTWRRELLTHERCTIAEVACPGAVGLYLFLVMQARHERPTAKRWRRSLLASWAQWVAPTQAGGRAHHRWPRRAPRESSRRRQVPRPQRRTRGDPANRTGFRQRVEASRNRHVTRYTPVTDAHGNAMYLALALALSLGSDLKIRSPRPDPARATLRANRPTRTTTPRSAPSRHRSWPYPTQWRPRQTGGTRSSRRCMPRQGARAGGPLRWLSHAGHRASKGRSAERSDALYWLNQVKVPEEREAPAAESRDRERDDRMARERQEQQRRPEMPKQTRSKRSVMLNGSPHWIAARKGRMKPTRDIYGLDLSALNGAPLGTRPTPECPGARLRLTRHDARELVKAGEAFRSDGTKILLRAMAMLAYAAMPSSRSGLLACPASPSCTALRLVPACRGVQPSDAARAARIGRPMTSAGSRPTSRPPQDLKPQSRHRRRARQPRPRCGHSVVQPPRRWPAGRLPRVHRCRPYRDRGPPREGVQRPA